LKIDRLLGIVIYLLNRDTVSARALAEKFEVSPRTIQRDMETLCLAGIPVAAAQGVNGGYSIVESFRMSKHIMNPEDFIFIITALKGLSSAYENRRIEATFEKFMALSPADKGTLPHIHLDFGVLREGFKVSDYLTDMETAIHKKMALKFEYTSTENHITQRIVEPVAVTYKWYAWYLFGYCREKQDYRLFRLSRIRNLKLTSQPFTRVHKTMEELLEQIQDKRQYMNIKLQCPASMRVLMEESFPNACITEAGDHDLQVAFSVPESEKGWFGILLGYGNKVRVLEPEKLRMMLIDRATEILDQYRSF
jgi:predicted DNA-binding transcriptional regulator YafY